MVDVTVISPFPEYALPRVWSWIQEFRWRVADDFSPATLGAFMGDWERRSRTGRSWAVCRGTEIGGLITVQPFAPGVMSSHCLFKKTFWGHETTLPALRMVYQEVFEGDARKIFSLVFRDNSQILGLVRKLGFEREGVFRQQTMRGGKPVDMIAVGLLKGDFYAYRAGVAVDTGGGGSCGGRLGEQEGRPNGLSGVHHDFGEHQQRPEDFAPRTASDADAADAAGSRPDGQPWGQPCPAAGSRQERGQQVILGC